MGKGNRRGPAPMPSQRRQLNIRLDRDMERLVPRLLEAVRRELGLKVSQSDLFRLGMKELAKKYLPDDTPKRK